MCLRRRSVRRGVAAIEMAVVCILFVVPLLLGIWEVGRLIQVQQIVANSAREGARLAAQGFVIEGNGTQLQIMTTTGTPNVTSVVVDYLQAAGLTSLNASNVTVTFTFITARNTAYSPITGLDPSGTSYPVGSIPTQPCYGDKGEIFTVYVSIPWSAVRWTTLGPLNPSTVSFTVTWQMLVDDQFSVNTTLPSW